MTGDDEATTDNEYQQTMMRTTGDPHRRLVVVTGRRPTQRGHDD